jgi:hypothetical protein
LDSWNFHLPFSPLLFIPELSPEFSSIGGILEIIVVSQGYTSLQCVSRAANPLAERKKKKKSKSQAENSPAFLDPSLGPIPILSRVETDFPCPP